MPWEESQGSLVLDSADYAVHGCTEQCMQCRSSQNTLGMVSMLFHKLLRQLVPSAGLKAMHPQLQTLNKQLGPR